ncbi:MAG: hypothetical protein ACE5HS_03090 [bacterium]
MEAEAPEKERLETHSPRFVGRAVVVLATDANLMQRTGGVFKAGQLRLDYGFTDIDGSQPEPFCMPEGFGERGVPKILGRNNIIIKFRV